MHDGINVVNQAPDSHQTARAFENVEFKVVVDAFMNDTAQRADLILPSTLILHPEPLVNPQYPLRLLTLVRRSAIHSQILPEDQDGLPRAWIAPDNAKMSNIDTDRDVYLVSPLGRLKVSLDLMPGLHPGVVLIRRGDWMNRGGGVNQLIAAGLTDIGSSVPYYDQYVRPLNDGIHQAGNPAVGTRAMLSVYGTPIRRLYVNQFDPMNNLVSRLYPSRLRKKQLAAQALETMEGGPLRSKG